MIPMDVGIFLSAAHLSRAESGERKPQQVLDQVENATKQLMTGGGTSVRVVVADCADPTERRIAEEYAAADGFRIRHVPSDGATQSAVVAAEIFGSVASDSALRVVVIGDSPATQSALIDTVHRLRRWVVCLTHEWSPVTDPADLTYHLPLDPRAVFHVLYEAEDALTEAGLEANDLRLSNEIGKRIAGFTPKAYGFASMAKLRMAAQRSPRELLGSAMPVAVRATTPARTRVSRTTNPLTADVRRVYAAAPVLTSEEMATISDIELAGRVLTLVSANIADLTLTTEGITEHHLIDGIRAITGVTDWRPSAGSLHALMQSVADATLSWSLGVPPGKAGPTLLRVPQIPEGWSPWLAPPPFEPAASVDPMEPPSAPAKGSS